METIGILHSNRKQYTNLLHKSIGEIIPQDCLEKNILYVYERMLVAYK